MASSVALALGLSVYLLLPVRASVGVPLNWRDPQTWDAFKIMLSRGDYWFKKEVFSLDDLWQVIASLANDVSALFSWPVLTLATAGLVWSVVQRRQILFAAGCWAVGNFALVASHGSRYDLYETNRYFMMLHAALVLLAACGAEATAAVLGNLRLAPRRATAIAAVSATALIAVPALFHYPAADQSRAYFAFDYAHNLLRNTSQNATLGVFADNEAFTTAYLSIVERVRPDVTLFSLTGDLFPNSLVLIDTAWYDPSRDAIEREIIQAAPAEVFYTEVRQLRGIPGWILLPYGMLYRLQPDDQPISLFDQWYLFVARDMGQPLPYKDSLLTWLEESYREIPVRHQQLANVVQQLQRLKQIEQREPHQTLATLERAELLASREMFSQARTVLADGLRRNPRSTQLLMALGKLEFYRNKRLGLRLLRQATVAGPTDPEAWSALAFAYDRTLQIGPAIAAWKKATRYATTATNKVTAEDTVIRLMDFQAKTGLR